MRTRLALLLLVVTTALVLGPSGPPGAAQARDDDRPGRILVVSIPRLTWDQVVEDRPPHITELLATSAVGNTSLRTIGPRTTLGEAYATIGSGNRAGVREGDDGRLLGPDERVENGSALDAFIRRTGTDPGEADLLQLSIGAINALNDRYSYGAKPGSLGSALVDAGVPVALVANADIEVAGGSVVLDPDAPTGEPDDGSVQEEGIIPPPEAPVIGIFEPVEGQNRPAGLALMTRTGVIERGVASRLLLTRDAGAPFGLRLDTDEVVAAVDELWAPGSVGLVELSDLDRADLYRARARGQQADALMADSLARTDEALGRILALTDEDDMVILTSPVAPRSGETLTPMAIRGGGFSSGTLSSGTTRRPGYVTLPDVAPTILDVLGLDQPDAMTGALISASNDGDRSVGRYEEFVELNRATAFRDRVVGPITVLMVVLQVLFHAIALLALARRSELLRRVAVGWGLVTMSVPFVAFALGLVSADGWGTWGMVAVMLSGAGLLTLVGLAGGRGEPDPRRRAVRVALVPVVAIYVLLLVDVVLEGRLQLNTVFGYSPVVAGRFAGFGNPAYSLFSISTVLIACGAWYLCDGSNAGPGRRRALVVGISALFLVTVVVDGHPALGSDVGGVLSIIPTAFLVVWLLLGRKVQLRAVLLALGATAVALAGFGLLDLRRPADQRTHLGRLIESTFGDDGGSNLTMVLQRKLNSNLNILLSSTWSWAIPLALVLLVRLSWHRPKFLEEHLPDDEVTRATLWGGTFLCALGMAVNDSGIAIPAVMFTLLLPFVLTQALARPLEPDDGASPDEDDDGPGDDGEEERKDGGSEDVPDEPVPVGASPSGDG